MKSRAWLALGCGVGLGFFAACFQGFLVTGRYQCDVTGGCPTGLVCDYGLCCNPTGQPSCLSRVPDGGVCLDGGTPKDFFEDADHDGYGVSTATKLCAAPFQAGFADNANDCDDMNANRNPMAPELCNGTDDNCNGQVDETFPGIGTPCDNPGGLGVCAHGLLACIGAQQVCAPPPKSREACDNVDNNCDGDVDEKPECGGPLQPFTDLGVKVTALKLAAPSSELSNQCLRGYKNTGFGSWGPSSTAPQWTAAGKDLHILVLEPADGGLWDLNQQDLKLRLSFKWDVSIAPIPPPKNAYLREFNQPVVYLCSGDAGFKRLVYKPDALGYGPMRVDAGNGVVNEEIPLSGNARWVVGNGTGGDFSRVDHIELLVGGSDELGVTTGPTLRITFSPDSGFYK